MAGFTDITILGIDNDATRRVEGYNLYDVTFNLSATAPVEWCQILDQLYEREAFYNMRRRISAGRTTIVLLGAGIDEHEMDQHIQALTSFVKRTNEYYRQYLANKAEEEQKIRERKELERQRITELADRYKFD